MADITGVFKSTVKMLKVRHKDIAAIKNASGDDRNSTTPTRKANGTVGDKNEKSFSEKAKKIVDNITRLRAFLVKNRKAYMAASSQVPLAGGSTKLTEQERDQIDTDAMNYMKLCNETLTTYKTEALHGNLSTQHRSYRTLVLAMISEYLKAVCQLYSEQKAIRVKRAVDRQKMSRLELSSPRTTSSAAASASTLDDAITTPATVQPTQGVDDLLEQPAADEEFTSEEAQLFKLENEQLYNEMNSTLDDVRQIEGKVVEISRLQDIFTEKVLEQDADISRVGDAMVHSTENVMKGNDDIREAMKNNAGMRVWIIFGICVLSFTLLFLDWYND